MPSPTLMSKPNTRIANLLTRLYGEAGPAFWPSLTTRLEAFHANQPRLAAAAAIPPHRLTASDAIFITCGDQISEPRRPLDPPIRHPSAQGIPEGRRRCRCPSPLRDFGTSESAVEQQATL